MVLDEFSISSDGLSNFSWRGSIFICGSLAGNHTVLIKHRTIHT
jgi:hypothetical protein